MCTPEWRPSATVTTSAQRSTAALGCRRAPTADSSSCHRQPSICWRGVCRRTSNSSISERTASAGLSEPERIHQVCHPVLAREFPRLRTVEGPDDHLPTQLTSFIGRTRELRDVMGLLNEHRLVHAVAEPGERARHGWRCASPRNSSASFPTVSAWPSSVRFAMPTCSSTRSRSASRSRGSPGRR